MSINNININQSGGDFDLGRFPVSGKRKGDPDEFFNLLNKEMGADSDPVSLGDGVSSTVGVGSVSGPFTVHPYGGNDTFVDANTLKGMSNQINKVLDSFQ